MSKLGYAVKRAMKMDWKKMRQTADMLHEKTGKSRAWLMQDMLRCALRYNAGYMDYKIAAMYNPERCAAAHRHYPRYLQ